MDLLSEIYEKYKARAERCGYRPIMPVIWGSFLEMLEESINTATKLHYSNWSTEKFDIAKPWRWVEAFFKQEQVLERHQNRSSIQNNASDLSRMFQWRNNKAHYNFMSQISKSVFENCEKGIKEFIDGLSVYEDFYTVLNQVLSSDGRQKYFAATASSICRFYYYLVKNSDITQKDILQKSKRPPWEDWEDKCLEAVSYDLIDKYGMETESTKIEERFLEIIDLIDNEFGPDKIEEDILTSKLQELSTLLESNITSLLYGLNGNGHRKSELLLAKFNQWQQVLDDVEIQDENTPWNIIYLQTKTSPDGNEITIDGIHYLQYKNASWSSERIPSVSLPIENPTKDFVWTIENVVQRKIEEKLGTENTSYQVNRESTYVLLEMDFLACSKQKFSALYEWGWMESKDNLLNFAGIYTILKKKNFEWIENYKWNQSYERSRGKTRPQMPVHQCSTTKISYPQTQDSWKRNWTPKPTYTNILFINKNDELLYQRTIDSYNTHRAALIIGEDAELRKLISSIQNTSTTTVLDIFHQISTLNNNNYSRNVAYVKAVFSYKDWKLQTPTSHMQRRY